MAAQALRSTVAAAGDAKAQGAALCAGLAALAAPGSELDKAIVEVFRLSTETVFPDDAEAWVQQIAVMTTALVGGVAESVRRTLDGIASEPHKAAAARVEMKDAAAIVSIKKASLPSIASWVHPSRGVQPVESAARWTSDEFRSNMDELAKICAEDEALACHFTSNGSAHMILSDESHGLRASMVGQLDGGVSLCLRLPHDMGWAPYGRDAFRTTVGRALWGEKAGDVLLTSGPDGTPGPDADKLDLLIIVKVKKAYLDDKDRRVPGRDAIVILPRKEPELLAADGHHWLPKQQIVKVVRLMGDSKAMEVALAKRMTALTVAFATDEVELQQLTVGKPPKIAPIDIENLLFVQESGGLSQLTHIECVAKGAQSARTLHASADLCACLCAVAMAFRSRSRC